MKPGVFLDRDGTINRNPPRGGFVTRPDDLELLPGAARAIARLRGAGYATVVYSNQSGVAKGLLTIEDLAAVNARLKDLLAEEGAALDGIYSCPHEPGATCECRKPAPGMILRAARELDIDLTRSWAVGDAARDLEAGRAAGCRTVFVHADSYPGQRQKAEAAGVDASVPDLQAAVEAILAARPGATPGESS